MIKWWFFSADDEVVGSEIHNWVYSYSVSTCLCKNSYVYEGQKQKWTVCEPYTILKENSDKSHGIVLIFYVTEYAYTYTQVII